MFLIRRIKETRSTRKANKLVKGPEPGAMRHHVGCVHKHLNHGTEEKNEQRPRVQAESNGIERVSQNLTTLLHLCNNVSRGICIKGKHGLAEAEHQTRPRRGGTPNTASQRRNTKQHDKGKGGSKTH